jgi:hypothetical protein
MVAIGFLIGGLAGDPRTETAATNAKMFLVIMFILSFGIPPHPRHAELR